MKIDVEKIYESNPNYLNMKLSVDFNLAVLVITAVPVL